MNGIYGIGMMEHLPRQEGLKDAMIYERQEHPGAEIVHVNDYGSSHLVDIASR